MNNKDLRIDTKLVHTGDPEPRVLGAVSPPIFQSANYEYVPAESYHGITYDFIDGTTPETWAERLKPSTRAIYVESITNPLLQVPDLEAVVGFAREHGLVSIIDNTFATPVNFRPPELGFDLSLHSCTKYLNGHSDIVGGAVIGISDSLIRFSTGIEAVEDLIDDLEQALAS